MRTAEVAIGGARGIELRIRGLVQGVGFRPTVYRHAQTRGIVGEVGNEGDAVVIRGWGEPAALAAFFDDVISRPPPLARIDTTTRIALDGAAPPSFTIVRSASGGVATAIVPDASTCASCYADTLDPSSRRFRHPFTNCTECGPRYSIVHALPYDRAQTSMAAFEMCRACRDEYETPGDRRFHAQPNACPACGPSVRLVRLPSARGLAPSAAIDACAAAGELLRRGEIVAIKSAGGYHLACDATDPAAVARLRARKRRPTKALALMARDVDVVAQYCQVDDDAAALLDSAAAPIVLLRKGGTLALCDAIAPGLREVGFFLPNMPLHHLLLQAIDTPVVMTSGNLAEAPPCIDDDDAHARLAEIADWILLHDRPIVNRVDDSVVRIVAGASRTLRRARGLAPAPMSLPPGFEQAPPVLAFGGQLKNTVCVLQAGEAVVSPHIGDLADARARVDYAAQLDRLPRLYRHTVALVACDLHPDYVATHVAHEHARTHGVQVVAVQHHHAHIAACMVEHGLGIDEPAVLGVALDGMGLGDDGALWGGELLRADYCGYARLATFKPVRLLGGDAASREPWRNLYAHLIAAIGWSQLEARHGELEVVRWLASRPRATLDAMLEHGTASPLASSCGRLFDAVAAAVGIFREQVSFEGEAAMQLEAAADGDDGAYPFDLTHAGLPCLEPRPMWHALLDDLARGTPVAAIASRFHRGLADAIVAMVQQCSTTGTRVLDTVVLTGGVFQNALLLGLVSEALAARSYRVLTHAALPSNDGNLSLGQAAVAAARSLRERRAPCA